MSEPYKKDLVIKKQEKIYEIREREKYQAKEQKAKWDKIQKSLEESKAKSKKKQLFK